MSEPVYFESKVIEISDFGPTYTFLSLEVPTNFRYLPGQYTYIVFNDEEGEYRAYYSIASSPSENKNLEFCITKSDNPRQRRFYNQLKEGTPITLGAPASGNLAKAQIGHNVVAIAGGSGIAPIRSILAPLIKSKTDGKLSLIYGCRHGDERPFHLEIDSWSQNQALFSYHTCADSPGKTNTHKGKVTDILPEVVDASADYLLCGPKPMLSAIEKALAHAGIDKSKIHYDGF